MPQAKGPFIVTAIVQGKKYLPYIKIAWVSNRDDLAVHNAELVEDGWTVASVKVSPADEMSLKEFVTDAQGNTLRVDEVPVDARPHFRRE